MSLNFGDGTSGKSTKRSDSCQGLIGALFFVRKAVGPRGDSSWNAGRPNLNFGMISERIPELRKLSAEEKLILAAELTNEVGEDEADVDVDPGLLDLVRDLHEDYLRNQDDVVSWDEMKGKRSSEHG